MRSMSFALAMLATGAISTAALAQENTALENGNNIRVGTGVICDTQDEAQEFVRIMSEHDAGSALQEINGKASNPMACGMATVAFRTGKSLGEIRTSKGSFDIYQIEVVAGAVDGSWREVPSRLQFTAMAVKGLDI